MQAARATVRREKPEKPEWPKEVKSGSVIVKKGTESKTFKVGDKTKYSTTDKKDAALADIKVGDKVKVGYTDENGVLAAHRVGPPDVPKKTE